MLLAALALTLFSIALFWSVSESSSEAPRREPDDEPPRDGSRASDPRDVQSVVVFDTLDLGDELVLDPDALHPDSALRILSRYAAQEGVAFQHHAPRDCFARVGPTRYRLRLAHFSELSRFVILIDDAPLSGGDLRPPSPGREWLVFSDALDRALERMEVDDVQWFARQDLPESILPG